MLRLIRGLLQKRQEAKALAERLERQRERQLEESVREMFRLQRLWLNAQRTGRQRKK